MEEIALVLLLLTLPALFILLYRVKAGKTVFFLLPLIELKQFLTFFQSLPGVF